MRETESPPLYRVTETQLKYKKIDWARNIKMEEKMRSAQDKKGGGLVIATSNKECLLRGLPNKSDDLLIVEIEVWNVKIVIMLIYLDVKDKERNRKIVEDLEMNLERREEKNVLLMGDFNGHLGFIGMQELNYNGQIVLQTMERYNLALLNGAEECQGTNTREQGGHRSAIYSMLVNVIFRALTSAATSSAHYLRRYFFGSARASAATIQN